MPDARKAVEMARADIADSIGAKPEEIYFTSGGTRQTTGPQILGKGLRKKGRHLITSAIEHHAVSSSMESLTSEGFEITVLPVDKYGMVSPADLEKAIRPDTIFISIMLANNEIGTIQPIEELAEIAKKHNIPFHTDAVQAVGHIPVNVDELKVDMLSMSSHKFGGPQGVGALYIRKGVRIPPLMHGGGHERGRRSGTENVAGVCGMAAALKHAVEIMPEANAHLKHISDRLFDKLLQIPYTQATGHPEKRLPGTVSVVFNYIEGESIILLLDSKGISASSGSACTSGSLDPSHVLLAIGLPHEVAHGSVRLSLGKDITEEDADYIAESLTEVVDRLRTMSPLWKG